VRLLFISSFHLFKDSRFGGVKRLYYLARELAREAEMTLICMDGCRELKEFPRDRPAEFPDSMVVPDLPDPGPWERVFRAPSDLRAMVASRSQEIRSFLSGRRYDAVLLAYPWSLSFLGTVLDGSDAPVTYLDDDFLFEQFGREAAGAASPVVRLLKSFRRHQTLWYYRSRLVHAAGFIGISDQEMAVMRRHFPTLPARVVKYGLPLEDYPVLPLPGGTPVLGFIGNYGHRPNLDALEWMSEAVMPAIRAKAPGVRFLLAGLGMPSWFSERHLGDPDVMVRGDVADLRDFYSEITLFINPIRKGRGLRTKLLEAAAFGRPILSTSLGAEGLEDLSIRLADTPEAMGEACARLLADPGLEEAVRSNRIAVEREYSAHKVAERLLSVLRPGSLKAAAGAGLAARKG
jgi:glycosyltransferase involved in cell wall biosynthesis